MQLKLSITLVWMTLIGKQTVTHHNPAHLIYQFHLSYFYHNYKLYHKEELYECRNHWYYNGSIHLCIQQMQLNKVIKECNLTFLPIPI